MDFFYLIFLSLLIFRGHSTREPASSRVTYFILRAYTGSGVRHSQSRKKIGRGFGKNADEWTGGVEIKKKFLAVSVACMAIYLPTRGFKGRMSKHCVLTRWDFNFCVRSSPLRGTTEAMMMVDSSTAWVSCAKENNARESFKLVHRIISSVSKTVQREETQFQYSQKTGPRLSFPKVLSPQSQTVPAKGWG